VYEQFKGFSSPLPQVVEAQEIVASNTALSSRLPELITDKGGIRLLALYLSHHQRKQRLEKCSIVYTALQQA
jgi:hypothetical protein